MAKTPQEQAAELAAKIKRDVEAAAGKGLNAAIRFLASRVKETLSVPAPRRRVKARNGDIYYVATTKATPGAPPRMLSGRMRGSITSQMISALEGAVGSNARAPTGVVAKALENLGAIEDAQGFNYPRYHEEHDHKFLEPTYEKHKADIAKIVGRPVAAVFKV